jgi:hypothetical protein
MEQILEFVRYLAQRIETIRGSNSFETMNVAKDRFEQFAFCFAIVDCFMKVLDSSKDLLYTIVKFCQQQALGLVHGKIRTFSIVDCQLPICRNTGARLIESETLINRTGQTESKIGNRQLEIGNPITRLPPQAVRSVADVVRQDRV